METSWNVYDYPEPDWVNEEDEEREQEEREILGVCPICGDYILYGEETANDNSNSYGGECHEECFREAQESRLK